MNSIIWNHEIYSCLLKSRKSRKLLKKKRKLGRCMLRGEWLQGFIKNQDFDA